MPITKKRIIISIFAVTLLVAALIIGVSHATADSNQGKIIKITEQAVTNGNTQGAGITVEWEK